MNPPRPKITQSKRQEIVTANPECYLCKDLGLPDASLSGYRPDEIHIDHVRPFGRTGGGESTGDANLLPLHAKKDGLTPDDPGFESSKGRDCHKIKSNNYQNRTEFVRAVRARMEMRSARFFDEIGGAGRNLEDAGLKFEVAWGEETAEFGGRTFQLSRQVRKTRVYEGFDVDVPLGWMCTDHSSQVRPAKPKELRKLVNVLIQDDFPIMNSVHARIDSCGHIVVFDGNHRATALAISHGSSEKIPVKIWNISASETCAVVPPVPTDDDDTTEMEENTNV